MNWAYWVFIAVKPSKNAQLLRPKKSGHQKTFGPKRYVRNIQKQYERVLK